jgi:hypothetical protein
VGDDASLTELVGAIARGDHAHLSRLHVAAPGLALALIAGGATGRGGEEHFLDAIGHQVYSRFTPRSTGTQVPHDGIRWLNRKRFSAWWS